MSSQNPATWSRSDAAADSAGPGRCQGRPAGPKKGASQRHYRHELPVHGLPRAGGGMYSLCGMYTYHDERLRGHQAAQEHAQRRKIEKSVLGYTVTVLRP